MKKIYVGVDLGGTKIFSCALKLNDKLHILGKAKAETRAQEGQEAVIKRLEKTIHESLDMAGISLRKVAAVGIGVPGAVNAIKGQISFAANLGWQDVKLKKLLQKTLDVPVFINNDANLGTLAEEKIGAAKGAKEVFGVYWGTGIGGGLVCDGKIVHGHSFTAGEVGHMVIRPNGKLCSCGRKGCFEAYAGKWALTENIYRRIKKGEASVIAFDGQGPREDILKSSAIKKAFQAGDKVLREELLKAVDYFALGLANIVNVFNPQVIVVGGGMIESMEEELLPLLQSALENKVFPSARFSLVTAQLGDFSVLAGAAFFARQELKALNKK